MLRVIASRGVFLQAHCAVWRPVRIPPTPSWIDHQGYQQRMLEMTLDIGPFRTYTKHMKTVEDVTPLTPAVFSILFSLATGEKHGYEIMKRVKQDTQGKIKMGNGTLYGSLKRMLSDELIEDAGEKIDPDSERRKYYRLTELGRKALHAEMQRYLETVLLIQQRQLLPGLSVKVIYE
jgi:DNA-binding PadR family transcriptional regulator